MRPASDVSTVGPLTAATGARMDAREFVDVRRRITAVLDVDPSATSDEPGLAAAVAADTFNAEACDSRRLLTNADYDVRAFGTVRDELARILRERADARDARRRELIAQHAPLLS